VITYIWAALYMPKFPEVANKGFQCIFTYTMSFVKQFIEKFVAIIDVHEQIISELQQHLHPQFEEYIFAPF
jgi:hypothetical protein